MEKKRRISLTEVDVVILTVLYKVLWAHDYHLAIFADQPLPFIRARLKQLAQGDLIGRISISRGPACNYITAAGIAALGLEQRNIRIPNMYTFLHSLAEADVFTWLSLPRQKSSIKLGAIITERDIAAKREMIPAGHQNGKQLFESADRGIHCPDGYMYVGDKLVAIEVERVMKSKTSRTHLSDNIASLHERFRRQIWVYEKEAVRRAIEAQKVIYGDELIMVDLEKIRTDIGKYIEHLPGEISKKSGRIRRDLIGELMEVIPLNRIENLYDETEIELEV
ncbi:MAG: hypothetical protein IKE74_05475 [Mogibacterium sp.]|nr:hypothetical protein [Mogibacterium sp.]